MRPRGSQRRQRGKSARQRRRLDWHVEPGRGGRNHRGDQGEAPSEEEIPRPDMREGAAMAS